MINLLPSEDIRQLRAARSNTLLIRYNILLLAGIVFLGLMTGVTYIYLTSTKATAESTIAENRDKVSDYSQIEDEAEEFRNNLATAKQILDKDVSYTKVILEISQLLPGGVILDNLTLDPQTFGSETTITAQAKDYASALALKDAFEQSSLFTNVHFQTITVNETPQDAGYPISANLNVTIRKEAAR